ncbi:hypothetical protein [Proteiniphilum sp.]|uniref:hypothetical protein n=1 Tax=Proteiniphilum sp. TaxID=1926877 RepID=UPI002B218866|nr:hypothetical protein [Proteiniphilum sp.]MEA4918736.1 hypothetical protein [Proteiniphilum sp.]
MGEYCGGKRCGKWYFFTETGHLWFVFKDFSKNTFPITNEGEDKSYITDYKCYTVFYYPNGNKQDEGLLLWSEGEAPESDFSVEYGEWKCYDEDGRLTRTKVFK